MATIGLTDLQIRDKLDKQLEKYSREPFKEMLVSALSNGPEANDIKVFAAKSPDRYAQYVTMFAKLSGYNEKIEHEHKFKSWDNMSDAELYALRDELDKQLNTVVIQPVVEQIEHNKE